MKDHRMKQTLENIARRGVPENTNLWPTLSARLEQRPIADQYEPPAELTPAEAGTLIDNSADMRDITATLVDLVVRGDIKIEERDEPKVLGLFGGGREFVLHRLPLPAGAAALTRH